jgi:hypothetical protein
MLEGVGPRTMQSLALVSEVIHGAPSRFKDPARFSLLMAEKTVIRFRFLPKSMMKVCRF